MTLIYAFVARGTTVLADFTTYTGVRLGLKAPNDCCK